MFILTRSTNRPGLTDPVGVGGPVQLSSFLNKLRPRDRSAIIALEPGQRAPAILCPFDGDIGFPVEVFRCPGGNEHDAHFNGALKAAREGVPSPLNNLTMRQARIVNSALSVASMKH
jgi:hypothetical protein